MRQPSSLCLGLHGHSEPAESRPAGTSPCRSQRSGDRLSVGLPNDATGTSSGRR